MAQFGKSEWMDKGVALGYTRISTNGQDKTDLSKKEAKKKPTLMKQFKFINDRLKMDKLPTVQPDNWFAEVGSGTDRMRGQWNAMMRRAEALAVEGKRPFIVVQDPSRFARNTRHAMVAIDTLHEAGIPVYAVREGLQTGSVGDLHPTEELIFLQLLGSSAYVSQVQKEKADQSVTTAKEEGTASSSGYSLFPFAKRDPLEVFYEQIEILRTPPYKDSDNKWQGGPKKHAEAVVSITGEYGPTVNSVRNTLRTAETRNKGELTPKEYKAYRDYRTKIRNILKERGSDPHGNKGNKGKFDFPASAMMMMVTRSLQDPTSFRQRTDKEIQEYLTNPKPYLSVGDSAIWTSTVSKR
jgi:DNA invertase Pin-like site-specific DNA recombinase